MTTAAAVALAFDLGGVFLIAVFGVIYLTRRQFMPYHAVAVGKQWLELDPPVRVLLLALMRASGGLCIAVTFLELVLLYVAGWHGARWALYAAAVGGLLVTAAFVAGMTLVTRNTQAKPPWIVAVVGGSFFVIGLGAATQA